MKRYEGIRHAHGDVDVSVISYRENGPTGAISDVRPARPLRHIPYHSPDGFEWAYGGSGPADLALAILADHFAERIRSNARTHHWGSSRAWTLHQAFKRAIIATLPRDGWTLTGCEIDAWIAAHVAAQ